MSGTQQALLTGGAAGDPNYASVVSLLHFNGTNGTQVFTDEKGKTWSPGSYRSWVFNGNAQLDTAQSLFGASSLLLDGTGDFLSFADSTDFEPGAGDFTIEVAFRINSLAGQMGLVSKWVTSGNQRSYILGINTTTGTLDWIYSTAGSSGTTLAGTGITWATGQWYRAAISRVGTDWHLYLDGTRVATGTAATPFNSTAGSQIGAINSGSGFNGWIDELRFTKGAGRYSAGSYTLDAAAFPNTVSADASYNSVTSLLHFNGGDTAANTVDSAFSPGVDTAQSLYGGASLNSNGTGYIETPTLTDFNFGSGDFTIEAALRSTSFAAAQDICAKYIAGTNNRGYIFRINSGGTALQFQYSTAGTAIDETVSGSFSFSTNTWYKLAVSRVGTTIYLFVDGALVGSSATIGTSAIFNSTSSVFVGGHNSSGAVQDFYVGHLDELRITKGVGRYTATYTPQSAAFPNF